MTLSNFLQEKNLDPGLAPRLLSLMERCLAWNEKINVTAVRERDDFIRKNLIDSLTPVGLPELCRAKTVLDIGTGGGFPGLPLALAFPEKQFLLLDSVGKKLKVVSDIAERLFLSNVSVRQGRAEDLARDPLLRENFDLAVSRAVAPLPVLVEYGLPFVAPGRSFLAYKSESCGEEVESARRAIRLLGGGSVKVVSDGIEGSGHVLVFVEKTGPTPKSYPRRAGTPRRDPL